MIRRGLGPNSYHLVYGGVNSWSGALFGLSGIVICRILLGIKSGQS
jgi:hypothetical protein